MSDDSILASRCYCKSTVIRFRVTILMRPFQNLRMSSCVAVAFGVGGFLESVISLFECSSVWLHIEMMQLY